MNSVTQIVHFHTDGGSFTVAKLDSNVVLFKSASDEGVFRDKPYFRQTSETELAHWAKDSFKQGQYDFMPRRYEDILPNFNNEKAIRV